MFGFKAYFWDEQVAIEDRVYRCNEILTACLNLSEKKLEEHLWTLRELRHKVQLGEDLEMEPDEYYDDHVQAAQRLFYKLCGIAKKLPPYRHMRDNTKFDTPVLHDLLNNVFYWEDTDELIQAEDPRWRDEDFSNEYGFVVKNDAGNYSFYHHTFVPSYYCDPLDESTKAKLTRDIENANIEIRKLFDKFIGFVQDLILIQKGYSRLLDEHIHRQNKFLSSDEMAACYIRYLRDSKQIGKAYVIQSSGQMRISHEIYRLKNGGDRLCETYTFDSLGAFLYVDFFRGLSSNHLPRRCDHCGNYFLLSAGKYSSYCERPLPNDKSKTCRDVGSRRKYDEKCKNDPVWLAFNRAYKAHYARYMKKKMTTAEFEQWSRYATELREKAAAGELEQSEYLRLIKI